ncbi:glycerate kinase [bacterium]|nr:glycerate kinase [bacterium]
MNVLVAPDSFKGSISAIRAAEVIAESIHRSDPAARCILLPQADGGEGTLEVVERARGGSRHAATVQDPSGNSIEAAWLEMRDGRALIESAAVLGYTLVADSERDPRHLRSTGLGQLIAAAAHAGARSCLVGLGGSATNDAGLGCAQALGYAFTYADETGQDVYTSLERVRAVKHAASLQLPPITALVDVRNVLCGARGATAVYGPQKGVDTEDIGRLDRSIAHFSEVVCRDVRDVDTTAPGMGAAGGLGFALAAFCNASLQSGADTVRDLTGFSSALDDADIVVTGEGSLDAQSGEGKVIGGIAREAHARGIPVVAFAGRTSAHAPRLAQEMHLHAVLCITPEDADEDDAMRQAEQNLAAAVHAYWSQFSGTV